MKLHLGILDIPYGNKQEETTGFVAELLEEKYSVMQTFFDMHDKEIVKDIEDSIAGALENVFAGNKNPNLFAEATGNIEKRFRDYIDAEEHGIQLKKKEYPKAGARKKRQYKKVESTTAFIDSGLYRLNMKSWIEE